MRVFEAAITFPCGADWKRMQRIDDRERLCVSCQTAVTDLSAMSEDEARRALAARGGNMCIRYLYDAHTGEIAFNGASRPIPAASLTRRARRAAAAGAALLAPMLLEACGSSSPYDEVLYVDGGSDGSTHDRADANVAPLDAGHDAADAAPDAHDAGQDADADAH